ncbi:hypothetical protein EUGRSUZ_H04510 [Eucalyptus grandis]|uniref:Uncharacterized protein n=2 Tax=Eucalyptus grandis TaxID=71139 RepID=A0ACC3JXW7_EUCGR|nr:hypothetical protein EUGRSUZ_H04510 [Eucalyptus grandis]
MVENETLGTLECNDKFFRDTILNFLSIGIETTGLALTGFFWALSMNSSIEMRIREEIRFVIPKEEQNLRVFNISEHMHKLVYLHGAVCKSLRLYPPLPFQHKCPTKLDVLPSGHKVDPGTKILVIMYAMGRMKSIWGEDCWEFRPERYGFHSDKNGAATIIHNYEVHVMEDHIVRPSDSIILHMKHGLKVKLARRRFKGTNDKECYG